MNNGIDIRQGDCLGLLYSLSDHSVDFCFYDPPYNVGKKYDGYTDNLSEIEYKAWMREVIHQTIRVSVKGITVFVGSKLSRLFFDLMPREAHQIIVHKRAVGVIQDNYFL